MDPPSSDALPAPTSSRQWGHPSSNALQPPSISFALFLSAGVPGKCVGGGWHSPKCISALGRASTGVVSGSPEQCRCSHGPGTLPCTVCVWSRSTVCLLGYCSRELYSFSDNSLRKYRQCVRNAAHFWAVLKRRMASPVGRTLFSSQLKISRVPVKGAGTRILRTDVFLAQDNPSRDARLSSQKENGSAMEIHPGRLTWARCRVRQWAWKAWIAFFLPFPYALV